jgi:hypothetical protein
MTLEEINNLRADRDTDALVDLFVMKTDAGDIYYDSTHQEVQSSVPCFSTDMNDAMRLVHKIMEHESFVLENFGDGKFDKDRFYCRFGAFGYTAIAPTAPLAISKAALMSIL